MTIQKKKKIMIYYIKIKDFLKILAAYFPSFLFVNKKKLFYFINIYFCFVQHPNEMEMKRFIFVLYFQIQLSISGCYYLTMTEHECV